jgi:endonuclease VIII
VPEGDTIFRTATSLRTWIGDRVITAAAARDPRLGIDRLIGRTVVEVSTHGKHLFLEFASIGDAANAGDSLVLRTHMMMTGSWHVYREGDRRRRPERQIVVSLTAGDRVAVCFNAPVVELLTKRRSNAAHGLGGYGPDILADSLDIDAINARRKRLDPTTPVGVALLDQHVVAGIGNIYRCESLFQRRISAFVPQSSLTDEAFSELIRCAAALMHTNLSRATSASRSFGTGDRPWVYGRSGRPCRVCRQPVQSAKLGRQSRTVYWCESCQPGPGA